MDFDRIEKLSDKEINELYYNLETFDTVTFCWCYTVYNSSSRCFDTHNSGSDGICLLYNRGYNSQCRSLCTSFCSATAHADNSSTTDRAYAYLHCCSKSSGGNCIIEP